MTSMSYRLILGDCLEKMKELPDESVDLVLTDPPYGITQNSWDTELPFEEMWEQLNRITKESGVVVMFGNGIFMSRLMLSNAANYKYKFIWVKSKATNFLNAKKQPLRKYEEILVFYRQKPTYNPQMTDGRPYNKGIRKAQNTGSYGEFQPVEVKSEGGRYPTDVLYFATAESEGEVVHPTQKPVALLEYLIKTYTNPSDTVLDFTMGSGSTGVACVNTNRNFIGMELYKKYFEIARKRIEEANNGCNK